MSKFVDHLVTSLEKEQEIYEEVLELAKRKKQIIIDGKLKELEEVTRREQSLTMSLVKLEEIRDKIVNEILKEVNVQSVENIGELMEHLPPGQRLKVNEVKKDLMKVIHDVSGENENNKALLKQSLDIIEFNMNVLTSIDSVGSSYESNGIEADEESRSLFDVRG